MEKKNFTSRATERVTNIVNETATVAFIVVFAQASHHYVVPKNHRTWLQNNAIKYISPKATHSIEYMVKLFIALCKLGFIMDQSAENLNCQTTLTSITH
jgi:TRAP-type C4-dicarboxylate transport system permease large subunit